MTSMAGKRNKKKQAAKVVFPAPLAALLVVVTVLGLSFLWLCGRCENLGRAIKALEHEITDVKVRVQSEEYKWSNLTSPERFEKILQQHELEMSWPGDERVVRLRTSSLHELASEGIPRNQYARSYVGSDND